MSEACETDDIMTSVSQHRLFRYALSFGGEKSVQAICWLALRGVFRKSPECWLTSPGDGIVVPLCGKHLPTLRMQATQSSRVFDGASI